MRWRQAAEVYQNRIVYILTFVLAAVPYGMAMSPAFALGIVLMQVFVATSQWLGVREQERLVAARHAVGSV